MNFLQELESTYGNAINDGLSAQTTLKGKTLAKAKTLVLASSLAGLIRKVSTERGTDYLFKLLEDYDGSIVDNFGKANEAEYDKWKADGDQLMPVLLISSIVKENIINHISRVIKENYQSTKKIFALLIPVLLSYVSKQLKEKKYSKKELVKALRLQKYTVKTQADEDISRELGMGTWHLNKTAEDEIEEPIMQQEEEIEEEEIIVNQPPAEKVKRKQGLPVWLWPLMLLGVLALLIAGLQLGLDNESKQTVTADKAKPGENLIADNSIKKKSIEPKIEPKVETEDKDYTEDYFNKDYFAESQKNDPDNIEDKPVEKQDVAKQEEALEEATSTPEEIEAAVPEKIEKKGIEAEPIELKENTAQPILPKDEAEPGKEEEPEVEEEKPAKEEAEPEKSKKKNYKGPLALLDLVANRTTASVLDFGNITDSNNQLTSKGKSMFNDVAEIMNANPGLNITIRGHHKKYANQNDNVNAYTDSETKANTALNYLLSKGIDASRVKAASVGVNEPVNARDPGNDKNNRISVKTK